VENREKRVIIPTVVGIKALMPQTRSRNKLKEETKN
jgi:hypothetical protein